MNQATSGWQRHPWPRYLFRGADRGTGLRILWAALAFLLAGTFMTPALVPNRLQIDAGQVAPRDIWAPRAVIDRYRTEELRAEAVARVPDVYRADPAIEAGAQERIAAVFSGLAALIADRGLTDSDRLAGFRELAGPGTSDAILRAVLASTPEDLAALEARLGETVIGLLRSGIRAEYLDEVRKQASADLAAMQVERELRLFGDQLAQATLATNLVFDERQTWQQRQEAADRVEPVKIVSGQVVVRAGEVVSEHQLAILQDLGLLETSPAYPARAGVFVLAGLLVAGMAAYLKLFCPGVYSSDRRVFLLLLILAATTAIAAGTARFSPYLAPIAVGPMLATILLGPPAGLGTAIFLGLVAELGAGISLVLSLAGGLAGVYGVATVSQRNDLMRSGVMVMVGNLAAVLGLSLVGGRSFAEPALWVDHLWGMANGFLSSVLTLGSLPFLENLFGIVTPLKLLELSNPNQPLLRKLLLEAPGTYQHCLQVANMAEAATERVGGDALLARVGAYYHDIGKVKRPYFFIDNQLFGDENPHDRIAPHLSARIITSHVRDGLELAREHKLPEPLIDFIGQHHGTGLVTYFFNRATEDGRAEAVLEQDFRYDGPIPQTRETAIVMLADGCEAAVRALPQPNPSRIEAVVRKIIRERLDGGQLNQSDLTLRDLDTIADEFTKLLTGMFHVRVQYPEDIAVETESRPAAGSDPQ